MRRIDVETWHRREQVELYRKFDQPHFNMCANVDVTAFYAASKSKGYSFTIAVLYVLARAANDTPSFRLRHRGDEVVEHDIVHPSTTVLYDDDSLGFCQLDYAVDWRTFAALSGERLALAKKGATLEEGAGRDDVLYTTSIPWVAFTSFAHPTHLHPADSIPRLAWGKRFDDDDKLKMPLSVQGHHAMMDGLHMGQYFGRVQDYLSHPDQVLLE
jgi:chloramphenicol O-acetyltransferase type A